MAKPERLLTSASPDAPLRRALCVGGGYVLLGCAWILGSDMLLAQLIRDPAQLTELQTLKGWFYVVATGALLVLVLHRLLKSDAARMRRYELQRIKLHDLSQFRESIIDNASIWINVLDSEARVTVWNQAAEEISGYRREEVLGKSDIWERLYPDPDYRDHVTAKVMEILGDGVEVRGFEARIHCRDGQHKIIAWNSRRFFDAHGAPGSIAIGFDITERKRMEDALERLAAQDPLTGLYNRRKLESMARKTLKSDKALAMLWIDVDNFKAINDRFGHHAGDEVLRRIATLLHQQIRDQDCAARYGGDELVVALAGSDADRAVELARRMQERLAAADILADYGDRITVSIGVAACPEHGDSVEAISAAADKAMYQAKRDGRNRVCRADFTSY